MYEFVINTLSLKLEKVPSECFPIRQEIGCQDLKSNQNHPFVWCPNLFRDRDSIVVTVTRL